MRIFVFTVGRCPFVNILMGELLIRHREKIKGIFVERGYLNNSGAVELFWSLKQKSGWYFAVYSAMEVIYYSIVLAIKRMLGINKLENYDDLVSKLNVPVEIIDDVSSPVFIEKYKSLNPDLTILIYYCRIVPQELLVIPKLGTINFHPGFLPDYKGLCPTFRALLNQDQKCGGTLHEVTPEIDAGKIISQFSFEVDARRSLSAHVLKIHLYGRRLIAETVGGIIKNRKLNGRSQPKLIEKSYFAWPLINEVREFRQKGLRLISFRDFAQIWKKL